jgi:transposase
VRLLHNALRVNELLTRQINDLERELRALLRRLAPTLLAMPGCGVLGAAMILGETAEVHRFRNRDAYARFTGTLVAERTRPRSRSGPGAPTARSGSTAAATAPSTPPCTWSR